MKSNLIRVSTLGMSRDKWLEVRRGAIGGSDAAAIIGLNQYSSPYSVWADKTGRLPDPPELGMVNKMRLIDANVIETEFEWLKSVANEGRKEEIDDYLQRIKRAPTVDAADVLRNQWISVKDRLPETEDEVLVLTISKSGNINVDKGYFANGRFVHRGRAEVTHWMPLPEPPEEVMPGSTDEV